VVVSLLRSLHADQSSPSAHLLRLRPLLCLYLALTNGYRQVSESLAIVYMTDRLITPYYCQPSAAAFTAALIAGISAASSSLAGRMVT